MGRASSSKRPTRSSPWRSLYIKHFLRCHPHQTQHRLRFAARPLERASLWLALKVNSVAWPLPASKPPSPSLVRLNAPTARQPHRCWLVLVSLSVRPGICDHPGDGAALQIAVRRHDHAVLVESRHDAHHVSASLASCGFCLLHLPRVHSVANQGGWACDSFATTTCNAPTAASTRLMPPTRSTPIFISPA
jgi:hypothetical protein